MNVEDLRRVINEYPNYKQLSKHPTVQELTNFILIRDDHFEKVRKLIHIFQKDNVVVPRKQLSELESKAVSSHWAYFDCPPKLWVSLDDLKELLEATQK